MPRGKRKLQEINAGSMADIAFLLLIFFLVTTTMDIDKGILTLLPPYSEEPPDDQEIKQRNVLEILVNRNDQLLVEGELMDISQLREMTKKHVDNYGQLDDFSVSPQKAVVSLKNDRGTSYTIYIQVQNELKAAYRELRDNAAMNKYGYNYGDLTKDQQKEIRAVYPLRISEAEPEDYGS